ncbi:hypothetical protein LAZ67_7002668 [Cordylochernes scorpioides]|uniref:Uncharacterized protein n=1 Tax=Cordylochernes scorpioides TaxID=51811 RepID=A0ABY6KND4_9ARAC|nr:hypothetical protein LAZ67_7002668 [Cordylochernes scorpioides]
MNMLLLETKILNIEDQINISIEVQNTCILPYSPQSATISRMLTSHGINTYFKNNNSLATILRHPITRIQRPATVRSSGGSVYSVSCNDCSATYIGETEFETGRVIGLKEAGWSNRLICVEVMRLLGDVGKIRLQWCRKRSTWNCADWGCIFFSDESRFLLCPDDRRKRVWRRPGQRVDPGLTVEHHTGPQQGVMVWGAISFDSRTPLVVIPGTLTAQRTYDGEIYCIPEGQPTTSWMVTFSPYYLLPSQVTFLLMANYFNPEIFLSVLYPILNIEQVPLFCCSNLGMCSHSPLGAKAEKMADDAPRTKAEEDAQLEMALTLSKLTNPPQEDSDEED